MLPNQAFLGTTEWTFGETLEYALDALELAMAKTAANPERPLAPAPAAAVVTLMLAQIVSPNCGHIGAASAASLPRLLICSQCGHGAFIKSSRPAKGQSVARDEQAACALLGSGMRRRASPQGRGRNNFRAFLVGRTSRRPGGYPGSVSAVSERLFRVRL